jgi:alginate O-acetyltransferase complex protein AlgI
LLFNSYEFLIFLPIVFLLYWFVFQKKLKAQNAFLLIASYLFYGWWDWRFLGLIALSSLVDYLVGLKLGEEDNPQKRNILLGISLAVNLGMLGFFKYFNFFIDSTVQLINSIGFQANPYSLQLILPIGISFYTFQTMSYTIDIYRKEIEPTKDIFAFFAFVSFFPQLVAGPIERASKLLPQFFASRNFSYKDGSEGMRWILWGLFKKVVIADNCAIYADRIFNNPLGQSGSTFFLGSILFTIQIYMDFSGYSDVAIGTSRLFGFRLSKNFSYPFFSTNIAEFWSKWHISLTSWFRDYVYIPLGGNRRGLHMRILNTFIVFILIGLWHGAEWKYIVWGGVNAMFFIPLVLIKDDITLKKHKISLNIGSNIIRFKKMILTFLIFSFGCLIFRSLTISDAWYGIRSIFSSSLFQLPDTSIRAYFILVLAVFGLGLEWVGRKSDFALGLHIESWSIIKRYGLYIILITMIILFAQKEKPYFYFQF